MTKPALKEQNEILRVALEDTRRRVAVLRCDVAWRDFILDGINTAIHRANGDPVS